MAARPFEELLRARIGLDAAATGPALIDRAVRSRLRALGMTGADLDRYRDRLERSPEELEALVEEVVIPETWFFRDAQPFALLADRLGRDGRAYCRVLCAPCSTGEEAYSVAMALIDAGLTPDRFHVLGVDLSRRALAAARRAVYGDNAFRAQERSFRDRHFRHTAHGYALDPAVAAAVEFRHGNLVDPAFLRDEAPFDAVFCRNLLIYLDGPARRTALAHLDRLLAPDGLLFVGHAENLGPIAPLFRPAGPTYCFAFERAVPPAGLPLVREPSRSPAVPGSDQKLLAQLDYRHTHPQTPPTKGAARRPTAPPASTPSPEPATEAPRLGLASLLADQGRHDEAAAVCETVIRRDGPTAALYFLLGIVRQAQGDRLAAERCLEKAVYLDPNHHEALLALSAAAGRRGDAVAAANFLRRAGRADAKEGTR